MREIHRLTTDLRTAHGDVYQVALPPDTTMTTSVDVLSLLQPQSDVIHLREHDGVGTRMLHGDNMVVTASAPHAPDYDRPLWECSDW